MYPAHSNCSNINKTELLALELNGIEQLSSSTEEKVVKQLEGNSDVEVVVLPKV